MLPKPDFPGAYSLYVHCRPVLRYMALECYLEHATLMRQHQTVSKIVSKLYDTKPGFHVRTQHLNLENLRSMTEVHPSSDDALGSEVLSSFCHCHSKNDRHMEYLRVVSHKHLYAIDLRLLMRKLCFCDLIHCI